MKCFGFDAKLERAKEHIAHFQRAEDVFLEREPYSAVPYEEIDTRHHVIEFRIAERCPDEILTLVGDAIHNLMSALDHLAYQLEIANNRTPNKRTYFPFYKSLDALNHARPEREARFGSAVTPLIDAMKPYDGGNDVLFALHELDIIDKHRLLITGAGYNKAIETTSPVPAAEGLLTGLDRLKFLGLPRGGPLQDGAELFRGSKSVVGKVGDPLNLNMRFHFCLAFGEIFEGRTIRGGLRIMLGFVQRTLISFRPFL